MYIQHCVIFLQGIIFIFLHNEFGAMCPKKFKAIKIADNVIFKGNLITNTGVVKTADRPNVDELSCSDSMTFLKHLKRVTLDIYFRVDFSLLSLKGASVSLIFNIVHAFILPRGSQWVNC